MDPANPTAEAISVRGDTIAVVGSNLAAMSAAGASATVYDLQGLCLIPGLIDSHVHLVGYGLSLRSIDLRRARSIEDVKEMVRIKADTIGHGQWVLGTGWDQDKLTERRFPTRKDLDEVAPDDPVFLRRVCGHVACLNSVALALVGIGPDTHDPSHGKIAREKGSREPSGILKEEAVDLALSEVPSPSEDEYLSIVESTCREMVKHGLTTVHSMSATYEEARALDSLRRDDRSTIRVRLYAAPEDYDEIKAELRDDDFLKLCGLKLLMDGSLGARTALLSEPYSDDPSSKGIETLDKEEARRLFQKAHLDGLQLAVHSIGDEATSKAFDLFEQLLSEHPRSDHRHRIEHASVLTPHLINRMKALGLIASVQPHFIISDSWVVERVGRERAKGVYAFRSLRDKGIVAAAGSDCPVEPPNPFLGMAAAISRGEREAVDLFKVTPNERLSAQDALEMHTSCAAFASREEGTIGVLKKGALADFVVLSEDPLKCGLDDLKKTRVMMTVVGGKIVYQVKELDRR